jgi:DNA-binding NarL/FixJ family response regulator
MRSSVIRISDRRRIPARILIVDDHQIVRMGLQLLLAENPLFELCGEASTGTEALEKVQQLSPDLVILDLSIPSLNGFDAAVQIKEMAPATKIVLFSIHDIPRTAHIIGADAFVQKGSSLKQLMVTIKRVLELA